MCEPPVLEFSFSRTIIHTPSTHRPDRSAHYTLGIPRYGAVVAHYPCNAEGIVPFAFSVAELCRIQYQTRPSKRFSACVLCGNLHTLWACMVVIGEPLRRPPPSSPSHLCVCSCFAGVHARCWPEESRDPGDREVDQVHFQAVPTLPVEGETQWHYKGTSQSGDKMHTTCRYTE